MSQLHPLLIQPGAVGDLIRLTAVARALARRWRAPCDLVARHPATADVFAHLDSVATLRAMGSRRHPYPLGPGQWSLVRWLRQRERGPVYLFEERLHRRVPWRPATRLEWLLRRAGIPDERVVTARHHERRPLENFVAYGLRLSALDPPGCTAPGVGGGSGADDESAEGEPADGALPELAVSDEELEAVRRWLAERGLEDAPLVLLQTVSRRTGRGRWPQARWRELIGSLLESLPRARVLLLGTAGERRQTAPLAAACADPRVHDVTGGLPLRRLFALLTMSHSCISLDTGPAHAAAALGCPLVVLTGRADPRRNRPLGAPGRVRVVTAWPPERWPDSPDEWFREHDLAEVEPEAVLTAWESATTAAAGLEPGPGRAASAPTPARTDTR